MMNQFNLPAGNLLRMTSLMAVGVGIAWALQSLGFGMAWVIGAAVIAGAGTGLICAANAQMDTRELVPVRTSRRQ